MKHDTHNEMKIIAHRGASHDAPENTVAAIRLGWEQQADGVEIDVHLSQDGEIVVMHDANTQRTTGFDGEIAALTLGELRELDAGVWKGEAFRGQRIPTLDEILELVPPQKMLVVEIKSKDHAITESLQASMSRGRVLPQPIVIIGFDYELMKAVKAVLPQVRVLWLRGTSGIVPLSEVIGLCHEAKFDGLNLSFDWPIDKEFTRRVHEAGLQLFVWTVDNSEAARRLATAGVDSITTNRPAWLREQLRL